jgi:hypothetical protein
MAYSGQTGGRALNRFLANQGLIQTLDSNNATIANINAGTITTATATITDATVVDLSAVDLNVTNEIVGETIVVSNATFTNVTSTGGVFTDGTIATLTTTSGFLTNADITNLDAINTTSNNITTSDLVVNGDIYFSGSISGNLQASVDANVNTAINANTALIEDVSNRLYNTQEKDDFDIDDISDRVYVNEGNITDLSNQRLRTSGGTMTGHLNTTTLTVGRTDISNAFNKFEVAGNARVYGELRVDGSLNIGPATVTFYDDGNGVLRMQSSSGTGILFDMGEDTNPVIKPLRTTQADANILIDNTSESQTNPQLDLGTNGAVGIGTRDPSGSLHISGDTYITSGKLMIGSNTQPTYDADIQGTIRAINSAYLATSSGNVGIGKTDPSYKLDVNGSSRIVGDMIVDNGATTTLTVYGNDGSTDNKNNVVIKAGNDDNGTNNIMENYVEHQWYADSANPEYDPNWFRSGIHRSTGYPIARYAIESEEGEHLTIKPNGNVGIGRSDPSYTLDVNGTYRTIGLSEIYSTAHAIEGGISIISGNGAGTVGRIVNDNSFHIYGISSDVYINYSGKGGETNGNRNTIINTNKGYVGIGTDSPSYKLHVDGSGYFSNDLYVANGRSLYVGGPTDDTDGIRLHYSGTAGYIDFRGSSNLNFRTGGENSPNTRMVITNAGNVGIGQESPGYKLDVNGTVRATGVTSITNGTSSSSTSTGALVVSGGVGVAEKLNVGGNVLIAKTGTSQHTDLQINAGNSAGNYAGNKASLTLTTRGPVFANENYPDIRHILDPDGSITGFYRIEGGHKRGGGTPQTITITRFGYSSDPNLVDDPGYYIVDEVPHQITDTTSSSSTSTGALVVSGGAGVGQNLNVGGDTYIGGTLEIQNGNIKLYGGNDITGGLDISDGPPIINEITAATSGTSDWGYLRLSAGGQTSLGGEAKSYVDIGGYNTGQIRMGIESDEKLRINQNGDVGIGTTNPLYKLDVDGTLRTSGATTLGSTLDVNTGLRLNTSTSFTEADCILNSNVIIGNSGTFSTADTSTKIFQVKGPEHASITLKTRHSAENSNTSDNTSYIRFGWYNKYFQMGQHRGNSIYMDRFSFNYGASSSDGALDSTTQNEIMTMKANGNVGIGTTSPAFKLDVCGNARVQTNSSNPLVIKNTTSGQGSYIEINNQAGTRALFGVDGTGYAGGDTTDVVIGNWSNGNLRLYANAGEKMRITPTGNIGIGQESPGYKLDVNGTVRATGATSITDTTSSTTSSNGALVVSGGVGVAENLNVAGKIGINAGVVANTLVAFQPTDATGRLFNFLNGSNRYGMRFTSAGDFIINNDTTSTNALDYNGKLYLQSQNDVLLGKLGDVVVKSDGKVGIGTTSPAYKLHVDGSGYFSNDLYVASGRSLYVGGPTTGNDGIRLHYSGSAGYIDFNGSSNLNFRTGDSDGGYTRMVITEAGNVGIGTTGPGFPLEVDVSVSNSFAGGYVFQNNSTLGTVGNPQPLYVAAKFNESVWSTTRFVVSSDRRIKNNINDISDNNALDLFRNIQPKTYEYIDKISRGSNTVYGFIAQEVKDVIPNAVTITKNIIPDYYKPVKYDVSYDTSNNNATLIVEHDISYNLDPSNNIRLYVLNKENQQTKIEAISSIIDDTHFSIQSDKIKDVSDVFLYGKEVDDFHTLNKDAIWTVATAALQEVDRNVEKLRKKDHIMRGKVSLLSSAGSSTGVVILPLEDTEFTNPQIFLQNNEGWSQVKGSLTGNTLTIVAKDTDCTDTIDYMVSVDLLE